MSTFAEKIHPGPCPMGLIVATSPVSSTCPQDMARALRSCAAIDPAVLPGCSRERTREINKTVDWFKHRYPHLFSAN